VELTPDDVGDVAALPDLLDQNEDTAGSVTADGAYDSETVYRAIPWRHPGADVIIPPASTAVVTGTGTSRCHDPFRTIEKRRHIGLQRRSVDCRRSLVETAMLHHKTIIGRRLQVRTPPNQKTEAKIGRSIINRVIRLGMPASIWAK
jgi:hypothetical protein